MCPRAPYALHVLAVTASVGTVGSVWNGCMPRIYNARVCGVQAQDNARRECRSCMDVLRLPATGHALVRGRCHHPVRALRGLGVPG